MKLAIRNLTFEERSYVREAVSYAKRNWPNAHLGDISPREDMHEAFRRIRRDALAHNCIMVACADLERDTDRYVDM